MKSQGKANTLLLLNLFLKLNAFNLMKKRVLLSIFWMFIVNIINAQIQGSIKNYSNQPLQLYQCLGDSLVFVDSTRTNAKGEFEFKQNYISSASQLFPWTLYRVNLQRNQWFYVLYGKEPVAIKTVYLPSPFYNIATDSLKVLHSAENKKLYEFIRLNELLKIANTWLLEIERLYPINDPFHPTIVKEYEARQKLLHKFVKKNSLHRQTTSPAGLITLAYYTPVVPDWKEPDPWRDSILAAHYFDYFNPAHPFYLMTDILPSKLDQYLKMRINKRDAYGQPVQDPNLLTQAAKDFLEKTRSTDANFHFCLHYLLKIADKEHKDDFFFSFVRYLFTNPRGRLWQPTRSMGMGKRKSQCVAWRKNWEQCPRN